MHKLIQNILNEGQEVRADFVLNKEHYEVFYRYARYYVDEEERDTRELNIELKNTLIDLKQFELEVEDTIFGTIFIKNNTITMQTLDHDLVKKWNKLFLENESLNRLFYENIYNIDSSFKTRLSQ